MPIVSRGDFKSRHFITEILFFSISEVVIFFDHFSEKNYIYHKLNGHGVSVNLQLVRRCLNLLGFDIVAGREKSVGAKVNKSISIFTSSKLEATSIKQVTSIFHRLPLNLIKHF
jgi:hypothetical protein